MERVVLGYDGSPAAAAALEWTAVRAAGRSTKVDVVNVVSPVEQERSEGIRLLAHAEEFLRMRVPGLEVELHRLEGGVPSAIAEFSRDVDLIVIGINTGHPIRAALAGWMPLRLSIDATAPVCMVPAGWYDGGDPVTVGLAEDASSDAALAFAAREARAASIPIRLVHAWLMPTPPQASTTLVVTVEDEIARHREVLDTAVERLRQDGDVPQVRTELVRDSRSAALLRFAGTSSMLVIGTHHRGPIAGGLIGSVAQEVLWRAECPVCVVPDREGAHRDRQSAQGEKVSS